jgi:hypothetical protein
MTSAVTMTIVTVALVAIVVAYLWPRPEVRFEKLFVATLGALVGSLLGRVVSDPGWAGHVVYVASGAFAFAAVDWLARGRRRHSALR